MWGLQEIFGHGCSLDFYHMPPSNNAEETTDSA
jgi:hypothetical protein